jgi:hypothetical protein
VGAADWTGSLTATSLSPACPQAPVHFLDDIPGTRDGAFPAVRTASGSMGGSLPPADGQAKAARTEGWIHLPTGGLHELNGV